MRQAGILAAGALYALKNNITRLAQDHENCTRLAESVACLPGISIDLESVQTNIVFVEIKSSRFSAIRVAELLEERDVQVLTLTPTKLRIVTHLDISENDIDKAIEAFKGILS